MTEMAVRITVLSDLAGPPGGESAVRAEVRTALSPYARDMREDAVGNLLVHLAGGSGPRLLVLVPMDEPALALTHVDSRGRGAIAPLGPLSPATVLGQRVVLPSGARAVVARRPASGDDEDEESRDKPFGFDRLHLDFGVDSRAEVARFAAVGDPAVPDVRATELAGGVLCGKALSTRAACAAALLACGIAGADLRGEVTLAFVAQSALGHRGVRPVVTRCAADLIVSLGAASASEGGKVAGADVRLRGGPALILSDRGLLASPAAVEALQQAAARCGVELQPAVADPGTAAAGPALTSGAGVPAGALAFPARHRHTAAEICHPDDVEGMARVLTALLTGAA